MFHVTSVENAQKLLAEGVDMELAGTTGGLQAGWGFYIAPNLAAAQYWANRLFATQPVILKVSPVPELELRLLDYEQTRSYFPQLRAWGEEHGYIVDATYSEVVLARHRVDPSDPFSREGLGWTVFGLFLLEEDIADGYTAQDDTLVILRPEKLTFSLYSNSDSDSDCY